jgi:hypothetical protein
MTQILDERIRDISVIRGSSFRDCDDFHRDADLVVSVDGKISRCRVDIPSGISKERNEASAFTIDHVAPF